MTPRSRENLSTLTNNEGESSPPPAKRQLTWIDTLLPTLLGCLLLLAILYFAGELLLGLMLTQALTTRQSAIALPFLILTVVLGGVPIVVLIWRGKDAEIRNSFFLPPLIPLVCVFVLSLIGHRDQFHVMTESEFKANLHSPQFVRSLGTQLSAMQIKVLRSAIDEGSLTADDLDYLLNHPYRGFELPIATSAHAYPQNFMWIAVHGTPASEVAMAQNPAISDDALRLLLINHPPEVVRMAQHAAAQHLCDPDALRSIYLQKTDRRVVSNRPNFLASDPDLPQLLADNPCTPTEVLDYMSVWPSNISGPAVTALARRVVTPRLPTPKPSRPQPNPPQPM